MIYHIQMAVKRQLKRQPIHFTFETMMQLNETDAHIIMSKVGNPIVDENGKSIRVAVNMDRGSEFIIPVRSLQPYFDSTPSTSQELCTLLEKEEEQKCKLWTGLVNMNGDPHLVDKTLSELCVMMLEAPSFSSSRVKLYLYSKRGNVVHIIYQKNEDASAASPFRPRKSQRSRSKSAKKRRNLKSKSKSKSKKRSPKPRRR